MSQTKMEIYTATLAVNADSFQNRGLYCTNANFFYLSSQLSVSIYIHAWLLAKKLNYIPDTIIIQSAIPKLFTV